MSEMLGNQYFMARNYADAMREFEYVISKYPSNKTVKKKLIVCYSQTGKVDKAIKFFYDLINEDIEFIINTDPIKDDCPCPELVYGFEKDLTANHNSRDFNLMLGIIWLFCDVEKSFEYFNKTLELDANCPHINDIINIIGDYIQSQKTL